MNTKERQNILRETLAERLHTFNEHTMQLLEWSTRGVCQFSTAYHELDEDDKDYLRAEVDAVLKIVSMMETPVPFRDTRPIATEYGKYDCSKVEAAQWRTGTYPNTCPTSIDAVQETNE